MARSRWYLLLITVMLLAVVLPVTGSNALRPVAAAPTSDAPVVTYPTPTGPYAVGRTAYDMVDETRDEIFTADPADHRELMIYIWYPAQPAADAQPASWVDDVTAQGLAELFGGDPNALTQIQVHAVENAPVSDALPTYPVLLMSHGSLAHPMLYTTFAEELASQGYIVVGMTHTYNAPVTAFPDGRIAFMADAAAVDFVDADPDDSFAYKIAGFEKGRALVSLFAEDASFVLDEITTLNADDPMFSGRFDLARVGMFGHSFGGAVTAKTMDNDPRIQAGAVIDGSLFHSYDQGIANPLLMLANPANDFIKPQSAADLMTGLGLTQEQADELSIWANQSFTLYTNSPTVYRFVFPGTAHENFCDAGLLFSVLPVPTERGPIDPVYALSLVNDYLLAFFNKHLNGLDNGLLDRPMAELPPEAFEQASAPAAALTLVPYTDPATGVSSVRPDGWIDTGSGAFQRGQSANDVTVYAVQSMLATPDQILDGLTQQFDPGSLTLDQHITTGPLAWDTYHAEQTVTPELSTSIDLALSEQAGTTYLIILVSVPADRDVLMEALFMPALAATTPLAASTTAPLEDSASVPVENPRDQALYLTMRDGVNIAIDVILPADLQAGQHVPTMIRSTRYWRAIQNVDILTYDTEVQSWNEAGYAVVLVDARGSGASSGTRPLEWSPDEIADLGEIVEWIVAQPWSNGRVGAWGMSYEGNTAELTTVSNHPAVKAVAPMYSDFDPLLAGAMPGGVFNTWFINQWSNFNAVLDVNNICGFLGITDEAECAQVKQRYPGVKPVDADPDGQQLAVHVAEHDSLDVFSFMQNITYHDDAALPNGLSLDQVSPYGLRDAIESSDAALYVWVSWLDAGTAEGALSRYLTFSNPQQVIIGAWNHSGSENADPFLPADAPTDPSLSDQFDKLVSFFDAYLFDDSTGLPESSITYYTLNAGTWTTTTTWPPEGFVTQPWYFGPDGTLLTDQPTGDAADSYTVDFSATSGDATRWHTQMGGSDVVYPDRATEDQKLLTYTTAPLTNAVEITGSPVITFYVASTESDGAFHVYLEDVAPDGRVTYITEGLLRAIHHQVSTSEPPYVQFGPYHSFLRADAAPLVPGKITEVSFALYPTSVLIEAGHSLRIAIAGADASVFERYPAEGTPVLTVQRSTAYPSRIDLPMADRP